MFTIFNRKELMSTFSMKAQSEVRRKLQTKGIKYKKDYDRARHVVL